VAKILEYPKQIKRQFSGPLDKDSTFATLKELFDYVDSELAYDGMIATCSETSKTIYVFNKELKTWDTISQTTVLMNENLW
jgi:hypothetical protein